MSWRIIAPRAQNVLLVGLASSFVLLIALSARTSPAPSLTIAHGDTRAVVSADRAWILLPNDCIQIRWDYAGRLPIHIDGRQWHESGEQAYCPTVFAPSPLIELTDHSKGLYLDDRLKTTYLPDFLVNLLGVAALVLFPLLAVYFLWTRNLCARLPLRTMLIVALALCFCAALLRLLGYWVTVDWLLSSIRELFRERSWHYFSASLALTLYLSLAIDAVRRGLRMRRYDDFIVVGGLLLFVALLYLPFGLETIAHYEQWESRAYSEAIPNARWDNEMHVRFTLFAPHLLGVLISSESFFGMNLLFALILWAKLAFAYGIFRQLNVASLYAFLLTALFALYPVDSGLMSLRASTIQFSILTLLTAVYLMLRIIKRSTRLAMLGLWTALFFFAGTYEAGYVLCMLVPLVWLHRRKDWPWLNINRAAIWYLVPVCKLAYVALLVVAGRNFYLSDAISRGEANAIEGLVSGTIENLLEVYRQTFGLGWLEAIYALGRNTWLPVTLAMLALFGLIAWRLWPKTDEKCFPPSTKLRLWTLVGLLLIIPAVGVLIWVDEYNQDLWRMYLFVPLPAAITVFSALGLCVSAFVPARYRQAAIVILCMLLILPAASRLIMQHGHYVSSAANKARILEGILRIAPSMEERTRVIVWSGMPEEIRLSKHIEELNSNVIGAALYVIYEGESSGSGAMCTDENCRYLRYWADHLADVMVFVLRDDLSVALLERPETLLSAFAGINYDVTALYNSEAPLPPRAFTMLGISQ